MPFTIAHPVAVIPLHRYLRRWTVPSALAIGSIVPDLSYLFPFGVARGDSHSLGGLFWFCLPVGCGAYLIFHLVLKRPLISLAPAGVRDRLSSIDSGSRRLPSVPWLAVLGSLLLGAATHLVWDAFTHGGGLAVRTSDLLRVPLFTVGSYRVLRYTVLQHGSTLFGILVLSWWLRRWLRSAAAGPEPMFSLTPSERFVAVATMLAIPAAWGLAVALSNLSGSGSGPTMRIALGRGVVSALSALGVSLLGFSAWWHLWWTPASDARLKARDAR